MNWKGRVSLRISVGFGEGQGSGLGDGENGRYSAREKYTWEEYWRDREIGG